MQVLCLNESIGPPSNYHVTDPSRLPGISGGGHTSNTGGGKVQLLCLNESIGLLDDIHTVGLANRGNTVSLCFVQAETKMTQNLYKENILLPIRSIIVV